MNQDLGKLNYLVPQPGHMPCLEDSCGSLLMVSRSSESRSDLFGTVG